MNFLIYLLVACAGFLLGIFIRGRSADREISELIKKQEREREWLTKKITKMGNWIRGTVLARQEKARDEIKESCRISLSRFPPNAKVTLPPPDPCSLFDAFNNDDDPFSLPPKVYIDDGANLYHVYKSKDYPYGNYTVFVVSGSDCYHKYPHCRNNFGLIPVNIMSVIETRRPCSFCGHNMPPRSKLPKWYINFKNASIDMNIKW